MTTEKEQVLTPENTGLNAWGMYDTLALRSFFLEEASILPEQGKLDQVYAIVDSVIVDFISNVVVKSVSTVKVDDDTDAMIKQFISAFKPRPVEDSLYNSFLMACKTFRKPMPRPIVAVEEILGFSYIEKYGTTIPDSFEFVGELLKPENIMKFYIYYTACLVGDKPKAETINSMMEESKFRVEDNVVKFSLKSDLAQSMSVISSVPKGIKISGELSTNIEILIQESKIKLN